MRRVRTQQPQSQSVNTAGVTCKAAEDDHPVSMAMIQALIPLGLRAVQDALQQEVTQLAGARYARRDGHPDVVRWGQQAGSVFLADQKVPLRVPRVRDRRANRERPLATYQQLLYKNTQIPADVNTQIPALP
jgi:hypothetical protein